MTFRAHRLCFRTTSFALASVLVVAGCGAASTSTGVDAPNSVTLPTVAPAPLESAPSASGSIDVVPEAGSNAASGPLVFEVPDRQGKRDVWLRPFTSTSIWNMPIGSEAKYRDANLTYTEDHALETAYLMRTTTSDPKRPLYQIGGWRDRCSGTQPYGIDLHIPDFWRPKPVTDLSTPNNPAVFLQPDGRTLVNVGAVSRCSDTGRLYGTRPGETFTDLYGDGLEGAHGASGLSQIGGAIRPGELTGNQPIRHALDLLISAEHLYWGGTKESSYRWPAKGSDRYAGPERYRGDNSDVRMGSLLALPPGLTAADLGLTTAVGAKLFDALQDYGAYLTDDAAWDATYLVVDDEALGTFPWGDAQQEDMAAIVMELHAVTNNGPQSIGGGGEPRRPLLPEFDAILDLLEPADRLDVP